MTRSTEHWDRLEAAAGGGTGAGDVGADVREWSLSDEAVFCQRDLGWEQLWEEAQRLGPDVRFAGLDDGEVERRLCVGAAALAAATCRWLLLLAEFVIRGGWAVQGARTPGMWLSWKLGMGSSTAREQVRVALRLRELPQIAARFGAGRLSYSKVRALTRIALPDAEMEADLLAWADHATAAELERIAAGFRTSQRATTKDDDNDGDGDDRASVTTRSHPDGTVSVVWRGPADQAAEILGGLHQLAATTLADRHNDPHAATGDETNADPAASGEAHDRVVETDDDPAASAEADVAAGASAEAAVGDAAGMGDDLEDAEPARRWPSGADLAAALADTVVAAAASGVPPDTSGLDRHTLVLHAPIDALAGDAPGPVPVRDRQGHLQAMDRRVLRRLACDAGIVLAATDTAGSPVDVGRRQRRLSVALRRALLLRDRACTFPGCHATRHLHGHHVDHWADGGPTDLANLVLLCSFHHRFVHHHGWDIQVSADGRHRFAPPGRDPLPQVGWLPGASAEAVIDLDRPGGPDGRLQPPGWYGPGNYSLNDAVAALQHAHHRHRQHTTA